MIRKIKLYWNKFLNLFKKKKTMAYSINYDTFLIISNCYKEGKTLQVKPKNIKDWQNVLDIYLPKGYLTIDLKGQIVGVRFEDIESLQCV
jgi:hypothetical protein